MSEKVSRIVKFRHFLETREIPDFEGSCIRGPQDSQDSEAVILNTYSLLQKKERTFQEAGKPILKACLSWEFSRFKQPRPAGPAYSFTEGLWQREVFRKPESCECARTVERSTPSSVHGAIGTLQIQNIED